MYRFSLHRVMRKYLPSLLIFYFVFLTLHLFAQEDGNMYVPHPLKLSPKSSEIGLFLGGSYYTGDLNPSGHFNRFTRPAVGGIYRVNFNPRMSAKAVGSYGMIEADD